MRIRPVLCFVVSIVALAAAAPLRSQSLLANGELDFDVATWSDPGGDPDLLSWESIDHDDCGAASGSGRMVNPAAGGFSSNYTETCVLGILPGREYSLEGFLRFPTGQTEVGSAWLAIAWIDSPADCDGGGLGGESTSAVASTESPGTWLRAELGSVTAPADARSAHVRVQLLKETAGGNLQLRFDGLHFVLGGGFLFGDGFEAHSTCRWSTQIP